MLSPIYYYVYVFFTNNTSEHFELQKLIEELRFFEDNDELISETGIDYILLELNYDQYNFVHANNYTRIEVKLKKVVFYLSAGYKYRKNS